MGFVCHLESDDKANPWEAELRDGKKTRHQGFLVMMSELLNQQTSLKVTLSGLLKPFELSLKSFALKNS